MKKSKGEINFNIRLSNRVAYTLIAVLILAIVGVGVYAYGTSSPNVFGHSAGELDLGPIKISGDKVGIGTTSPRQGMGGSALDVSGTISISDGANIGSTDFTIEPWKSSRGGVIGWNKVSGSGEMSFVAISGGGGDGGFSFYDRNTPLMRILKSGSVGIGTKDPTGLLELSGANARIKIGGLNGDVNHLSSNRDLVLNSQNGGFYFRNTNYDNLGSYSDVMTINKYGDVAVSRGLVVNEDLIVKRYLRVYNDVAVSKGLLVSRDMTVGGDLSVYGSHGFGGIYRDQACSLNNTYTGAMSCPLGYTSYQIGIFSCTTGKVGNVFACLK